MEIFVPKLHFSKKNLIILLQSALLSVSMHFEHYYFLLYEVV